MTVPALIESLVSAFPDTLSRTTSRYGNWPSSGGDAIVSHVRTLPSASARIRRESAAALAAVAELTGNQLLRAGNALDALSAADAFARTHA